MSLELNFMNKIKTYNPKSVNEILLFDTFCFALHETFNEINCLRLHGSKFLINYSLPTKPLFESVNCELCDLMLIIVSNKEIKVTCIQHKRGYKDKMQSYKSPRTQYYLLKYRPSFRFRKKENNILRDAKNPAISSYGYFYFYNGEYNMEYIVTDNLEEKMNTYKSKKSKTTLYNNNRLSSKYASYCSNLCKFEQEIKNNMIGSIIDVNSNGEVVKALKYIIYNYGKSSKNVFDFNTLKSLLRYNDEKPEKNCFDFFNNKNIIIINNIF